MAIQTAAAAGSQQPDQQVTEHEAQFLAGLPMLVLGVAGLLAGVVLVVASRQSGGVAVALAVLCMVVFLASALVLRGLTPVAPGQAREGELSLRGNAAEITSELSAEIAARVAPAGVRIIESRLTRLSYAPEIAQAMLRQQQASAVVGARQRIVEGAVGMVELALQRLQDASFVELDEERKASMVSNLLVVLCSEQATQPVVNTGTLYQ